MEIRHIGHSCFEIKNKTLSIITDPYGEDVGLKLPKLKANIVTVSHDHYDHNNVGDIEDANPEKPVFVVRDPGGYEVEGVLLEGIRTYHDDNNGAERGINTAFYIKMDGVSVCHLGDIGTNLSEDQLGELDGVDILIVPVGGRYTVDAEGAAKIVNKIEPRIVIPMHYATAGLKIDLDDVDKFVKEMGIPSENMEVLKIEKKDLPVDGMRLVII